MELKDLSLDNNGIYYAECMSGYWSNLSKADNDEFIKRLESTSVSDAVASYMPQFQDMIFSNKRSSGLELLNFDDSKVATDYGCMWGILSYGLAMRCKHVYAIDQTYNSLRFLKKRVTEERINNITVIHSNLNNNNLKIKSDIAVVNGVLEWIPIVEDVEVDDYFKKSSVSSKVYTNPEKMQKDFLDRVYSNLNEDGELYLAIENRYSYEYFIGKKDPHANLYFTTFLPRFLSNLISFFFKSKEYRNYIYSFNEIKNLLMSTGFKSVELYACFPNYHFPELILPYSNLGIANYKKYPNKLRITLKQKIAYRIEYFLMKYLKLKFFSPAIVVIAKK